MQRLTELTDTYHLTVQLVYYPPYHSKYNPIERVWGVLEQHWNGSLLDRQPRHSAGPRPHDDLQTNRTYRATHPDLEKYFVRIAPLAA